MKHLLKIIKKNFNNMTNLIKTQTKAISCVSGESAKEFEECKLALEKAVGNIVLGSAEKIMVFAIVIKEMKRLKPKQKIGFDFDGKKVFELRRVK